MSLYMPLNSAVTVDLQIRFVPPVTMTAKLPPPLVPPLPPAKPQKFHPFERSAALSQILTTRSKFMPKLPRTAKINPSRWRPFTFGAFHN